MKAKWPYILFLAFLSIKGTSQDRFNLIYPHAHVWEEARQILINSNQEFRILTTSQQSGENPWKVVDYVISDSGMELENNIFLDGNQPVRLNRSDATEYLEDGSLLYCGANQSGLVQLYNADGGLEWEYSSGLSNNFLCAKKLSDGSFVAAADLDFAFGFQLYRFDPLGNFVTLTDILPEEETYYLPSRIRELSAGDLIISGAQFDWDQDTFNDSNNHCCRIDSDDNVVWSEKWGNEWQDGLAWAIVDEQEQVIYCANIAPDSIIMEDFAPYGDLGVRILDLGNGSFIESHEFGPDSLFTYGISDFTRTSDGGYVVMGDSWILDWNAGFMFGFLCKLDGDFNQEWFRTYSHVPFSEDQSIAAELFDLEELEDGGFLMCGYHHDYDGINDDAKVPWLIRTDECGYVVEECTISVEENDVISAIFPNPSSGVVQWNTPEAPVGLRVYSSAGQLVYSENIQGARSADLSSLATGLYVLEFLNDDGTIATKPWLHIEE